MTQTMRGVVRLAAVVAVGALGLSACATREYVDQRIGEVNERITAVDAKASAADQKADQALSAAQAAQAGLGQVNQRIDSLTTTVNGLQAAPPPPPRRPRG